MIEHNGYTFSCEAQSYSAASAEGQCDEFTTEVETKRTAVLNARDAGWAIIRVRITAGAPKRHPSKTIILCPSCKHLVGL